MDLKPYYRKPNFYETDGMGIIYHANYVHWMEEARVHFMEEMGFGYEKALEAGIDFALVSISCKYRSMTRFGQTVKIEMSIIQLSPARMTVGYRMTDAETGELRCEAESEHFFYDRAKGRPVALKRAIPALYEKFSALAQESRG